MMVKSLIVIKCILMYQAAHFHVNNIERSVQVSKHLIFISSTRHKMK